MPASAGVIAPFRMGPWWAFRRSGMGPRLSRDNVVSWNPSFDMHFTSYKQRREDAVRADSQRRPLDGEPISRGTACLLQPPYPLFQISGVWADRRGQRLCAPIHRTSKGLLLQSDTTQ